jgi:hypothetical protein
MGAAKADARLSDAAGGRAADPVPDRSPLGTPSACRVEALYQSALMEDLSRREKVKHGRFVAVPPIRWGAIE